MWIKKIIQLKSYCHHRKELLKSFLKIFLMLKSDNFMSVKGEIEHITTLIKDSYSRSFFRRFSFYLISNWEFIGHLVLHQAWIVKNQNRFTRPHKLPSSSYGNGGPYRKPTSDGHSWLIRNSSDECSELPQTAKANHMLVLVSIWVQNIFSCDLDQDEHPRIYHL